MLVVLVNRVSKKVLKIRKGLIPILLFRYHVTSFGFEIIYTMKLQKTTYPKRPIAISVSGDWYQNMISVLRRKI